MMNDDLFFASIGEIGRLYRTGELSPVEVTRGVLERAEALNPKLNAVITLMTEEALASARNAEAAFQRGEDAGPLQGIPVSLKDLIYTKGTRTTGGSPIMRNFVPDHDATVAARLRAAGAVLFAKANTLEFAYGVIHPEFGPARNPWNPDYSAGGSSSGSGVLVSAGIGYASLGTDTGGSVRNPAALCGCVGLKPTYGRVSRFGVFPLSWSLDHVGPLARSAADAALVLKAIAGADPADPSSVPVPVPDYAAALTSPKGLRVGVVRAAWEGCTPDVQAAADQAVQVLAALGYTVVEVEVPSWEAIPWGLYNLMSPEASSYHEANLRERPQDYSEAARKRLEVGMTEPAVDYLRAQRYRSRLIQEVGALFAQVDLLAMPTLPASADRHDAPPLMPGMGYGHVTCRTGLFNLTGLPSVSVPCGQAADGMPIGFQLSGRAWEEATVLQAAHAFELAAGWAGRRPPIQ